MLGSLTSFSLPPYNIVLINFITFPILLYILIKIKEKKFALPAINVTGTNTINAVLETASNLNSPVIIQFSHGGAHFIAGKGVDNANHNASISGAISGAHHIHNVCDNYKAEVIIHTDHCSRKNLPWIDGLLEYGNNFYKQNMHSPNF